MTALELINFIKAQPITSHDIPIYVNGNNIRNIVCVSNGEKGYSFQIIIDDDSNLKSPFRK